MKYEKIVPRESVIRCPHCGLDQEEENLAEDYTYGGEKGFTEVSSERCVHCDKFFSAICVDDGIKITAEVR